VLRRDVVGVGAQVDAVHLVDAGGDDNDAGSLGLLDPAESEDHGPLVLGDDPYRPADDEDHGQGRDHQSDQRGVDHVSSSGWPSPTGSTRSSRRSTERIRTSSPSVSSPPVLRTDHQPPSTKTCPWAPSAERTVTTCPAKTSAPVLLEGDRPNRRQ